MIQSGFEDGKATQSLVQPQRGGIQQPRARQPWVGLPKKSESPNGARFHFQLHVEFGYLESCPRMAWQSVLNDLLQSLLSTATRRSSFFGCDEIILLVRISPRWGFSISSLCSPRADAPWAIESRPCRGYDAWLMIFHLAFGRLNRSIAFRQYTDSASILRLSANSRSLRYRGSGAAPHVHHSFDWHSGQNSSG